KPDSQANKAPATGDHRLIGLFVRHPTASNLLMVLMLIAGLFAIGKLNTQFFPTFSIPNVSVKVSWPGASATDIEDSIINALEPQLRFLDGVDKITSVAREGVASINIGFVPATNMQKALADAQQAVDSVTTLPQDSKKPVIRRIQRYDRVANLSVSGPYDEGAIRSFAKQIRDGLLNAGIDRVDFVGLRDREIAIHINDRDLARMNLTLTDIARKIKEDSRDLPSGILEGSMERQLRSVATRKTAQTIGRVEIKSDQSGNKILLQDVATLKEGFDKDSLVGLKNGHPAIEMKVQRSLKTDTLASLKILEKYLQDVRRILPPNLDVQIYNIRGNLVAGRLNIMIKNGLQGLLLVLVVLFLFLNVRIAFWVAAGIPVALMAAFAVMYFAGQSINMVSMFTIIMMMGIIVDDAIVVGEHTATRQAMGDNRVEASINGAGRMLTPVSAATMTTMASFIPIAMMTGRMGDIMGIMPIIVLAVLIASLIECFLILPGHLSHGFSKTEKPPGRFRARFDAGFVHIREGWFNRLVTLTYNWRYTTIAVALVSLFVVAGILAGKHIAQRRFPSSPADKLRMSVEFAVGTPRAEQRAALQLLDRSLYEAELKAGDKKGVFIVSSFTTIGQAGRDKGDNLAEIEVQLTSTEIRFAGEGSAHLTARNLIGNWNKIKPQLASLRRATLSPRRHGPGGKDVHVQLTGGTVRQMKQAAEALKPLLAGFPGVSAVEDDLPYGKSELILELTPRGRALGFSAQSVGTQVRNAFQGAIAMRFARGDEEIIVRVKRTQQSKGLGVLERIFLRSPSGVSAPLTQIVKITERAGFSLIKHEDGRRLVSVIADLDSDEMELPDLLEQLDEKIMPQIMADYGVRYQYSGAAEERRRSSRDMQKGLLVAFALIYIILAWVFGNYFKPLVVMAIIPFGFVGAVFGHMIMGYELTIISNIGLLGLTGILVNDSIILVSTAKERLDLGQSMKEAATGAARDRLRAVVLTSLTTIVGLVPLIFETSRQAAFLIPMAITMVFGLLTATILVLILVPSLLGIGGDLSRLGRWVVELYRPARTEPGE
ncbi:MAG: efflux RND transporter permease subunit, partial [Hyphomicrobiaceae bacterium]|nr:efflux RND transporter permease subunit [Hyphomicrobiaceae bacterium]